MPAPFVPKLKSETDVSYFDEEFTSESINLSLHFYILINFD